MYKRQYYNLSLYSKAEAEEVTRTIIEDAVKLYLKDNPASSAAAIVREIGEDYGINRNGFLDFMETMKDKGMVINTGTGKRPLWSNNNG